MRIYLDAAPVIYTVEQVVPYAAAVDAKLAVPGVVCVTSDLTRMECRVKPLRDGDLLLLQDFDDFFAATVTEIVPLSRQVLDRATEIRAKYGFKTPDAIHPRQSHQNRVGIIGMGVDRVKGGAKDASGDRTLTAEVMDAGQQSFGTICHALCKSY